MSRLLSLVSVAVFGSSRQLRNLALHRPIVELRRHFSQAAAATRPPPHAMDFARDSDETIFQLSSGAQKSGVAVIRISGSACQSVFQAMTGRERLPKPRFATLCSVRDPNSERDVIDSQALAIFFRGPHSFTGEDVLELHVHGGTVVVQDTLSALSKVDGTRFASAGEFTRRAFHNDKLDLTQVEGLADLLEAQTQAQRRQAVRQLDGRLSQRYEEWRDQLKRALAHTEAVVDFAEDEHDVGEEEIMRDIVPRVSELRETITAHLSDGHRGEILRDGCCVAIFGAPNVGKSSLLNILAKRPAAIVSDIPGTTRDVVEVALNLRGFPVRVFDTAGLRETSDEIEREGVQRAKQAMSEAHIKIAMFDASDPSLDATTQTAIHGDCDDDTLVVLNKTDVASANQSLLDQFPSSPLQISCRQQIGIDALVDTIADRVKQKLSSGDDASGDGSAGITRARHRTHLENCVESLDLFLDDSLPLIIRAEELRLALLHLGRITGRVDVEEILDTLFADFCIGK